MIPPSHRRSFTNAASILIAEDSTVIGNLIRFNLELAGFRAVLAKNGQEAFSFLQSERFDLLVTDYEMPILNGAQLCEMVRHELHLNNLPIVMCSAKCLELDEETMRSEYGIQQFLQKPFSVTELTTVIQELVAPGRALLAR